MTKLLIDEPSLQVSPTLATWIGLNEAIFLQQLHYWINRPTVGKTTEDDGLKYVRNTLEEWLENFPFFDVSQLKRIIKNLKDDGLILARADLNKMNIDRTMWYTIDYSLLEAIDGPVERLVKKSDKRRAARQSREDIPDNAPKVQNVPIGAKSTNSTNAKVQNVPSNNQRLQPKTTKKSLSKDKGGTPPGPKTIVKNAFLEITNLKWPYKKSDQGFWWSEFGEILHIANKDPAQAVKYIRQSFDYMINHNLSVHGPQSVKGFCRQLASGQTLNGATNATYQNGAKQNKRKPGTKPDIDHEQFKKQLQNL